MDIVPSISFYPAPHTAEPFGADVGLKVPPGQDPPLVLLYRVALQQGLMCSELLHTSLIRNPDTMQDIIPQRNGFVHTVLEAYNNHRALIIRPDDVWLAILTQFCFFVNGNAEALRSNFVAHEGKKELEIESYGNCYTIDPAYMAYHMTELMEEHITDASLREWIMPSFTTTTVLDRSVSAIVMMSTMKGYFSFRLAGGCGIPKVTLEGEKGDWEDILRRLERLKNYGVQTTAWYHLLRPVISRFVTAYDDPTSRENLDFWSKVAHWCSNVSGARWISGWILAFCVFDERGGWQGDTLTHRNAGDPSRLSAEQFASAYILTENTRFLTLDGFPYPKLDPHKIPCGYSFVDVKLNDNGRQLDTVFVAGLVGSQICSTGCPGGARDTVRPLPAWWYFIKKQGRGLGNWKW